jgi:hypothetical protein
MIAQLCVMASLVGGILYLGNLAQDISSAHPAIDFAKIVADEKLLISDIIHQMHHIITLDPFDKHNIPNRYLARINGRNRNYLPKLDSPSHRATTTDHFDGVSGTQRRQELL